MADEGFKRKLAAILSADVEGYSRLMDDDEEATVRTLTSYRNAITDLVQQFRGRVVDAPGDNLLAEFTSVVDAVNCAVEIQRDLAERNTELAYNRQMQFRIGVNLGDVIEEDGRIYGDGVNIAARVEFLSEAGGICISGRAYDQVANKLGLEYENLGEHQVKNISVPIRVYRVLSYPGAAAHRVVKAKETLGRRWRKIGFSAAAIVIVAVALVVWQFYLRRPTVEPASVEKMAYPLPEKPSIAVLPFDNLSGDPKQDYLADGISENIITALSYIPEMFVIARNSSFTYKGKPVKIQQVSEELGVRYILEGSVLKSEDRVRVTAQLIDALTGGHIWSERYDRDLKELFDLLDEITQAISVELQVKLSQGEQARMWYKSTNNLVAWGYTVKGLGIFLYYTKEAMAKSRAFFEQALELDPEYAHALTMLAWTHFIDVRFGYADSRKDSMKSTVELAKKAVELDENDPLVHSLLQHIYLLQGHHDKAVEEGRKAVALGPSHAEAHILFGEALYQSGLSEEAVQICEKAIRLHPHTPIYYFAHMMNAYYYNGRYEESLAAAGQLIDRSRKVKYVGGDRLGQMGSIIALMELGREGETQPFVDQVISRWPQQCNLAYWSKYSLYSFSKDRGLLQQVIDSLRRAGIPEYAPLPLPDKPSIAVLAFDNLSGDPEQEYFADGIAENIITALSKVGELFVIARNSSFTYKGKPVKVQQVSRELGVRYVLEGSVRRSGDRVRITAQLIDAKNGQHLWAENYDRDFKNIFEIQDEITKKIVTSLRIKLTEGEQARMLDKRSKNLDVYLKFAQAQSLWRKGTKEGYIRFSQLAQKIIDIEPESSIGYWMLGWYHWVLAMEGTSPRESMKKSFKFAQKALSLDESDSLSHGLLGNIYLLMRKYDKAIESGKRAVELDPNGAQVHALLGMTLGYAGHLDEGIDQLNKGIRLNPFPAYWYYYYLGFCYRQKGQYEDALTEFKKALQRSPDAYLNYMGLATVYVFLDRQEEAEAAARKVLEINPNFSTGRASKAWPFKNPADLNLLVGALRKAGLPK
jgi:TolB-like protein/class 3 adenylate cyclase/Tfp pilus assembly protein PilF